MGTCRRQFKKLLLVIATLGFALVPFASVGAAGSAALSLSSGSSSIEKDANFSITVNVSLQESNSSIQVFVLYDASKLQYMSTDGSGSAYDTAVGTSSGGGVVEITRYTSSGMVSGSGKKVATINFKGLAGSGTSNLTFGGDTAIPSTDGSTNQWNGNTAGGTFTHTSLSPVATPPSGGSGSGSGSGNGSGSSSGSGSGTSAPPPTTTPVDQPVVVSDPSVQADKRYLVAIIVKNNKGEPVEGAEVTLNEKTVKTDATGAASFTDIPAGSYQTKVKGAGFEKEISINVSGDALDPTAVQQFEIIEDKSEGFFTRSRVLLFSLIGLGVLLAIAAAIVLVQKHRPGGSAHSSINGPETPPENPIHFNPNTPPSSVVMPDNPDVKTDDLKQ